MARLAEDLGADGRSSVIRAQIFTESTDFGGKLGTLRSFNSKQIPVGYTQIVSLCTYSYFIIAIIARQSVHHATDSTLADVYNGGLVWFLDHLPFIVVFEFIVYVGWLKVAEEMLFPFGDDDDDFDCQHRVVISQEAARDILDAVANGHPDDE